MTLVAEPRVVVVEAHVALVDRCHAVLIVDEHAGPQRDAARRVRIKELRIERACEERVVHAEEHVAERVALAQDRLVDEHARIAGLHELDLVAGLLREVGEHVLRCCERIVGDECDRVGLLRTAAAARGGEEEDECEDDAPRHRAHCASPPGWTTSTMPSSSATEAGASTTTLLTPRVVPSGRSSPCSGY